MERREFEKLVREGYESLPEWVREKIKNVALLVEDEPSDAVRREEGLEPDETLLGLYHGVPQTVRGEQYGIGATLPDTITIYQRPIEEEVEDNSERIRQVVADTIWHEFAHHFGMNEHEVREREQKRAARD